MLLVKTACGVEVVFDEAALRWHGCVDVAWERGLMVMGSRAHRRDAIGATLELSFFPFQSVPCHFNGK